MCRTSKVNGGLQKKNNILNKSYLVCHLPTSFNFWQLCVSSLKTLTLLRSRWLSTWIWNWTRTLHFCMQKMSISSHSIGARIFLEYKAVANCYQEKLLTIVEKEKVVPDYFLHQIRPADTSHEDVSNKQGVRQLFYYEKAKPQHVNSITSQEK